jgi:riboflavin kinase/FMN adenylyltransferase
VAVGNFDGVHRGHQQVIQTLKAWAAEPSPHDDGACPVDTLAVTFATHPRQVLTGQGPPLLTSLEHRTLLLGREGVSGVVVLPFDREMASWSPEVFVDRVLVEGLGASRVLVGQNHRFGKDRAGDFALLQTLGRERGFEAREVALEVDGQVISSTAIRAAFVAGDLAEAERLLGRPPSVLGRVVQGDQRGRTIGFPTANLDLAPEAARPARGVYAAWARVIGGTSDSAGAGEHQDDGPLLPAAVNVGRRPTFTDDDRDLVEVHLLAGGRDLYGATLEVLFTAKLRDERRFDGVEALVAQIQADVAQARELLGAAPTRSVAAE